MFEEDLLEYELSRYMQIIEEIRDALKSQNELMATKSMNKQKIQEIAHQMTHDRKNQLHEIEPINAIFQIMSKLFTDPIHHPVFSRSPPVDTELLSSEKFEDERRYSPVLWADPLILREVIVGTSKTVAKKSVAEEVSVIQCVGRHSVPREILVPSPAMRDPKAIVALMQWTHSYRLCYDRDEAPIMRLLMLHMMLADPETQMFVSDGLSQLLVNVTYERAYENSGVTREWSAAVQTAETKSLQIPLSDGTSTLYYRTISEYVSLISGNQHQMKKLNGTEVYPCEVVFIPVKLVWRGQSWLMPYILAHTTTLWWNHAMMIKCTNLQIGNPSEGEAARELSSISWFPRSSTIYIPGAYQYICLVVVDATEDSYPENESYMVAPGIFASRAGNTDFSRQAHCALGRASDELIHNISWDDTKVAFDRFLEIHQDAKLHKQCLVYAAVLGTSRFNGFSVYPGNAKPKSSRNSKLDNIQGPHSFGSGTNITIGDHKVPDFSTYDDTTDKDNQKRCSYVSTHLFWRTDPLMFFASGEVKLAVEDTDEPMLINYDNGCCQYQLSSCTANNRILSACGVYKRNSECNTIVFQSAADIYHTILAHGSVLLGVSNAILMLAGVTMMDHNMFGNHCEFIHQTYGNLFPLLTDNFVIKKSTANDDHNIKCLGAMFGFESPEYDTKWMSVWYSGNVPWWFVNSILMKLGIKLKVSTFAEIEVYDDDDEHDFYGYAISPDISNQWDLSVLTSSIAYEKDFRRRVSYFDILTPTVNGGGRVRNWTGWHYNYLSDMRKRNQDHFTPTITLSYEGIVELAVIILPSARSLKMNTRLGALVSSDNKVNNRCSDHFIRGGLTYPDLSSIAGDMNSFV